MNPPPQWIPTDWALRAFTSMGFSERRHDWAYTFKRGDIILAFPEFEPHGFDVFHLFRTAKVNGIDQELWRAFVEEEKGENGPPPAA